MNNDPDYRTRRSHYDSLLLSYTYSGTGLLICRGKTYTLAPESGFIIDCLGHYESLRGHPVAVGGDVENRHDIILAKNYEAKKFSMPGVKG